MCYSRRQIPHNQVHVGVFICAQVNVDHARMRKHNHAFIFLQSLQPHIHGASFLFHSSSHSRLPTGLCFRFFSSSLCLFRYRRSAAGLRNVLSWMPPCFFVICRYPPVCMLCATLSDPRPGRRLVPSFANIRSHYLTHPSNVNTVPLISLSNGPYLATWCTFLWCKYFAPAKLLCFLHF